MRSKAVTPTTPAIKASYPWKLRKFKKNIALALDTVANQNKPQNKLRYRISKEKTGDLVITVREKGLIGRILNLSTKNRIQDRIVKEELEHNVANPFATSFSNLFFKLKGHKIAKMMGALK